MREISNIKCLYRKKEDQKDSPSYVVVGYVPLSCLTGQSSPLINLKSAKENFVFVSSPGEAPKQQVTPNTPITKQFIVLNQLKPNMKIVPSPTKTLPQHSVSNPPKKPTLLIASKRYVKIVRSPNKERLQLVTANTQKGSTATAVKLSIASKPNVKIVGSASKASSQVEVIPSSQIKRSKPVINLKLSKPHVKIVRSRIRGPKQPVISKSSFRDTRPSKCFCPACGQYVAETYLKTHIEAHDDNFDYFCRFCLTGFQYTKDRDAHIENEHNNFRYLCFPCNRVFKSRLYYMDHMDKHHPNPPAREFTCIKCLSVFSTRNNLKLHYRKHTIHQCDECGRVLASGELLKDHKLRHKGIKPVMCEECGKSFTNYKALDSHRKTVHAVDRPHACNICNKKYKTAIGLRSHAVSHSSVRPFQCDVCESSFKTKATLYAHKLKHNDTRPFSCPSCDKRFKTEMHLTTHLLTQGPDHDKTKFTCILCDQDFTSKFGLKGHMRRKHDVFTESITPSLRKKYSCEVCGKNLANVTNLADHRRIHTGERPFSCKICDKGFSSKRLLHEHRLVHIIDKPYSCEICDKSFKSKPSLKKHLVCHTR